MLPMLNDQMIKENNDKLLIFLLFQLESFTIFLRTSEQHVHRLTSRDTVLYPVQGTGSKNKLGGRVSISHILPHLKCPPRRYHLNLCYTRVINPTIVPFCLRPYCLSLLSLLRLNNKIINLSSLC